MEAEEEQEMSMEVTVRESSNSTVGVQNIVEMPGSPHPLPSTDMDRPVEEAEKDEHTPVLSEGTVQQELTQTERPAELLLACAQETEARSLPIPAPRRKLSSSVVPVPTPRTKTSQTPNSSLIAGNSANKCTCSASRNASSSSGNLKVRMNHPWLRIIHPGPWTLLPPALVPSDYLGYRSRVAAPKSFGKVVNKGAKPQPAEQKKSSAAVSQSGDGSDGIRVHDTVVPTSVEPAGNIGQSSVTILYKPANTGGSATDVTEAAASPYVGPSEARNLTRSLSVPTLKHADCSCMSTNMVKAKESDQVTIRQRKPACKENPFDRKSSFPKSKNFHSLPSRRGPAPGHGFPLIKRKVQTDPNTSTESLQVEMRELDKRLAALEQRGVELEQSLRDCTDGKEEEEMLLEWFSLHQERHLLVRRDQELGYLTMQQKLEERQADVEYKLRSLIIKQESGWTDNDRGEEQWLMEELVSIIEQKNQIINNLDLDMQREREEDKLLSAAMNSTELKEEGLKELRKSKGKFSLSKVLKLLSQKIPESREDAPQARSDEVLS